MEKTSESIIAFKADSSDQGIVNISKGVTFEKVLAMGGADKDVIRYDNVGQPIYLARQLEQLLQGFYQTKRPEMPWERLLPGERYEVPREMTSSRFQMENGNARFVPMAGNETGVPLADFSTNSSTINLMSFVGGFQTNFREGQMSNAISGFDPAARRLAALMRAAEETNNELKLRGNSNYGIEGLFNVTGALQTNVVGGAWTAKTGAQILDDLILMADRTGTTTGFLEEVRYLALPRVKYNILATKFITAGSGATPVLDYFKSQRPGITVIPLANALDTAGSGSTARAVCYDPSQVHAVTSYMPEPLAPQTTGLVTTSMFTMRQGGVMTPYPLSISYVDGF